MVHAQKADFVFRRNGRVHLNWRRRQFSRLLTAEVSASAVVMLDTPCSEVVWRVLATHSILQFPLHFPSRASPRAITFQLDSTRYSCQILIKLESARQIFAKSSNMKFHENPSSGSRAVPFGQTWRNFVNAPKNYTWISGPTPIISPHDIHWLIFIIYSRTGQLQPSVRPHNSLRTRLRAAEGRTCVDIHRKTGVNAELTGRLLFFFFCGAADQRGPWPPHSWGF